MAAPKMVTVRPRLQVERFSLYWKEPLSTETIVQEDVQLLLDCDTSIENVLKEIAAKLGWPSVDDLQRLDGFKDPWERVITMGRELELSKTLLEQVPELSSQSGDVSGLKITVVRKVLKADGWKIQLANDFLTDSDSDDEH
ncbi:hypothetical protein CEUSTIGMA_g3179.t1 [Chlamydomonas eustigma]|uniref:Uncharacterized protein n=1 Tax=Chlamydomonas eustigma TaxID=1157962 RepID=A0A250WY76_9CHLO|nr:hypothetical protein CEUSTIGMA_g3179.t1 [Chlamydomonas eustigma]|eukprot:GAX75736.1 hypothetical protein CEUSTIGMA_g3179.t1 [Chlamydomonas eustigma]